MTAEDEDFANNAPILISTAAGWFHPTTGYSLSDVVRIANFIASNGDSLRTGPLRARLERFKMARQTPHDFYLLLNRLMFRAAESSLRYKVLEKFYTLPEPLIQRFYAGTSLSKDRVRLLSGAPPVSVKRALKVMAGLGQPAALKSGAASAPLGGTAESKEIQPSKEVHAGIP